MASSKDARKKWEGENKVEAGDDMLYKYDEEKHNKFRASKRWLTEPKPFSKVKISAVALLKMVMHARSGGNIEVMGLMQGKIVAEDTIVITDSFALPVEASETRVNAQAEAFEYIIQYMELIADVGRKENAIGWYHSHPSYGCWLSGIDVATQKLQQTQGPWVAVVIDPIRTVSSGKVELGAFRTYPEGHTPSETRSDWQTIPMEKIEDFGVHANHYYKLDVDYYKSSLDENLLNLLWNKYWVNTLSSNPLLSNRDYFAGAIGDVAEKMDQAENQLQHSGRMGGLFFPSDKKKEESQLAKVTRDSTKTAIEQVHGLVTQVLKDSLFNWEKETGKKGGK
eukprot:TRINITY_DN3590_c0_g2_i1.p1 TRINITY_DN3590_c0_g2~~TRINITY_DN3590_c0_g2_i1.p1  ORF type:complete len:338 (+),score=67.30 TRINITY_DN3590_c0_g2_i1:106-1119(+)